MAWNLAIVTMGKQIMIFRHLVTDSIKLHNIINSSVFPWTTDQFMSTHAKRIDFKHYHMRHI